jgi:NTE family protein
MSSPDARPRIAIACQGGGSHTAFTAGVLDRLFRDDVLSKYRVVGLSGTSGGAICAMLAWSELIGDDPTSAGKLLRQFWSDNSASSLPEQMMNNFAMWASSVAHFVLTPEFSPYDIPTSDLALDHLRGLLTKSVDFGLFAAVAADPQAPRLLLGAVDVVSGEFKAFDSAEGEITADAVLASAAIPTLFRSVHEAGGVYWDGLFSQNPPVRDLLATEPDEIWVIQINAKERDTEPRTILEIADRRNELSGNLSLYQELHFIEKIDTMIEDGVLVGGGYKPITVRIIEMARSADSQKLGAASKMNRDPAFLDGLIEQGESRAEDFVSALAFEQAWRASDVEAVVGFFAEDCDISSEPPFSVRESQRGKVGVRKFVTDALSKKILLDLTRKQISGDRVSWRIRLPARDSSSATRGLAEAVFVGGKITSFRLGPLR